MPDNVHPVIGFFIHAVIVILTHPGIVSVVKTLEHGSLFLVYLNFR